MTRFPRMGLRMAGALVLAHLLVGAGVSRAYFAGGGKDEAKGNDCLIGYNFVDPDQVTQDGKKNVVLCTDCDPSCDLDGVPTVNGSCTIAAGVCINQSGVEGCTPPSGLDKASAKGKVKGVKGDPGKIVIDVPQLLQGSACGAMVDVLIPLKTGKKGASDGKATLSLSASVKKNKAEGLKARKDKDKLTYVCQPRPEGQACPITTTTTTSGTTTTTSTTIEPTSTTIVSTTSTTLVSTTSTTLVTTTSTTLISTTSTTEVSTTSTTTTTVVSTTSTSEPPTSTSSTTIIVTTTTTSTSLPTVLSFTTGEPTGSCGAVKSGGAGGTTRKVLNCGGLNIGGGESTVAEGPTPAGAETQMNVSGSGPDFTVSGRTAAQTASNNNCSDTGCQFGPYLPIASAGTSTCVRNTFLAPASGTVNTTTGAFNGSFPLNSDVFLTANATQPCPKCVAGVCDNAWLAGTGNPYPDKGKACTAVNGSGDTYDCAPPPTTFLGPISVALTPITTGTASASDAGGLFCPMQANSGAFGCSGGVSPGSLANCPGGLTGPVIDYIEEVGVPAGTLSAAPATGTLVSVFCIPTVGGALGFLVNGAGNLPGPGATSLPGTLQLLP